MEIGIEEKLNFNFELFQNKFHLKDCIIGRLTFNKVKLIIKSAEIHFYKKEILLGNFFNDFYFTIIILSNKNKIK